MQINHDGLVTFAPEIFCLLLLIFENAVYKMVHLWVYLKYEKDSVTRRLHAVILTI